MKKNTYKSKAIKLFLLFLIAMCVLSIVSRGVYASMIPKVKIVSIAPNQSISYNMECIGNLETSRELPICVIPELRTEAIFVRQGDSVEAGDILLRYDKIYLESRIKHLENEIETDRLTRLDYGNAQAWNSIKILDIATNEKQEKLNAYESLLENNGEILSDLSGIITDVKIKSGDFTTESAAFLIADTTANLYFSANITKDDTEHIAVGDIIPLKFRNGKITISDCEISAIKKTNSEDTFQLEISMKESELKIGETGKIAITVLSETQYDCIPLNAVHTEGVNTYVYVLEENEGFFGIEYNAVKRNIDIVEKNDKYAAVQNSGINKDDKIVLYSNKELFDGDTVRINP